MYKFVLKWPWFALWPKYSDF